MTDLLRAAVQELVSPEALLPQEEVSRWRTGKAPPKLVVAPASEEEMAGVLARASQEGWRVMPAGLGSWLGGGGPTEVDLVLSTRRLEAVTEYEPADLTFTAQAGIPVSRLGGVTREQGQWLPLDPPGGGKGSLGALVGLGVGGGLRMGYGTPRDHVLGVTLVSGDGRVLRWGGRVVKNVAGFDVTRLCIGSWGTLGVITSVSARLFPLPEEEVTLVLRGPDATSLLPAARAMALSNLPLSGVELLDPHFGEAGSEMKAAVAFRLLGPASQVEEMEARIRRELEGEGPGGRLDRMAGEESQELHQGLNDWEEGASLVLRLTLLPSELELLLDEARELAETLGRLRLSAHVGSGILRVAVEDLPGGEGALKGLPALLAEVRGRLEKRGGSMTLSFGPPELVEEVGAWGELGPERTIMEGLKRQFDPSGILAPGRFTV